MTCFPGTRCRRRPSHEIRTWTIGPEGRGQALPAGPRTALVRDKVSFVGDHVACVVAETREQARDAAELIEIDYQALPANTDTRSAVAAGAPAVWEGCPDNICFRIELGDRAATDRAF